MESLIETFHVDIKLLLAQVINFAIVFGILYYFALKPLMKILAERTEKIEKSLADAKDIETKLLNTEEEYKKVIAEAKKEAFAIIEEGKKAGDEKRDQAIKKAKEEIGEIINKEKEKMQADKAETLKEIRKEITGLITLSLEKVLADGMDAKRDGDLIKKAVKELK